MHQPLDARFQLHKRAVGHQVDHPPFHLGSHGVLLLDGVPGIGQLLLQPQADPLLLPVDVQHHHVDVLPHFQEVGWMANAAPAHVRDVQQPIDPVQIDERAEIGDVLHRAFANIARGHFGQQLLAPLQAFLLDQLPPRQHDILPFLVDLHHFEIVGIAHILGQVLGNGHVNLRSRQEGLHPDVHQQPALDNGLDFARDGAPFVADRQDPFPILLELGLLLGEHDHALAVFQLLDQDINFIAHLHGLDVLEFIGGNHSLALVANIHQHFLGAHFDDGAFDNIASRKGQNARLPHGLFHG